MERERAGRVYCNIVDVSWVYAGPPPSPPHPPPRPSSAYVSAASGFPPSAGGAGELGLSGASLLWGGPAG
eukprot:6046298-Pyramimonas_sp.AAC.1